MLTIREKNANAGETYHGPTSIRPSRFHLPHRGEISFIINLRVQQSSLWRISHIIDACLSVAVFSRSQYTRRAIASKRVGGAR